MKKLIKIYHRFRSELINIPISIAEKFGMRELDNVQIEYIETNGKQYIIITKIGEN